MLFTGPAVDVPAFLTTGAAVATDCEMKFNPMTPSAASVSKRDEEYTTKMLQALSKHGIGNFICSVLSYVRVNRGLDAYS